MQFPPLSLRSIYSRPTDSRPDMTLNTAAEGSRSLSRQGSLASFLPRAQNRGTADPLDRRSREIRWESPPITTTCCWPELLNSFSYRSPDTNIFSAAGQESETARRSSFIDTIPQAPPDVTDSPVGLSDPQFVRQKRRMLDSVNRLRATG